MGLADAEAVENHLVAGGEAGVVGGLHRAGAIDTGHHRPAPHHRRLAGDRQSILVVDGGPVDADDHVALHQVVEAELFPLDAHFLGLVAGEQDAVETVFHGEPP